MRSSIFTFLCHNYSESVNNWIPMANGDLVMFFILTKFARPCLNSNLLPHVYGVSTLQTEYLVVLQLPFTLTKSFVTVEKVG